MNRTLAARLGRSKHQFDVVDGVDSEHVFGEDGRLIEQVFPNHCTAATREVNRMRARVLAIALVVAGFLVIAPGLARGDGPDRPAPRVTYVVQRSASGGGRADRGQRRPRRAPGRAGALDPGPGALGSGRRAPRPPSPGHGSRPPAPLRHVPRRARDRPSSASWLLARVLRSSPTSRPSALRPRPGHEVLSPRLAELPERRGPPGSGGQGALALERGFGGVVLRREPRSSSSRSKSAGSWKSL
jgi:hypothetical protein